MKACYNWGKYIETPDWDIHVECYFDVQVWGLGLTLYLTHWGLTGAKLKLHLGPLHLSVDGWKHSQK